jgi:hypothetical protein
MNLSRNTIGMLKLLTSHYLQVTTETVEPSKEKKKCWLQIIRFSFAFILQEKNDMKRRNRRS